MFRTCHPRSIIKASYRLIRRRFRYFLPPQDLSPAFILSLVPGDCVCHGQALGFLVLDQFLGRRAAGAGVIGTSWYIDEPTFNSERHPMANARNMFEKMKRDSDKRRNAEEKREAKRVKNAARQAGGPAKPAT
jgi:hypothetical protein